MISYLYAFFIGLLVTVFVGVGIAAFYVAPTAPDYPEPASIDVELLEPDETAMAEYESEYAQYEEVRELYARNVALLTMGFAVAMLALSLTLLRGLTVIADGMLLGGLLTLIYSIGWSFMAGDKQFLFIVVTVGLAISLALGYLKFTKGDLVGSRRT